MVGLICVTQLLSQSQLEILKKENIKVIIALDNDETGRKRSEALGEQLKEANFYTKLDTFYLLTTKLVKMSMIYYVNTEKKHIKNVF